MPARSWANTESAGAEVVERLGLDAWLAQGTPLHLYRFMRR